MVSDVVILVNLNHLHIFVAVLVEKCFKNQNLSTQGKPTDTPSP